MYVLYEHASGYVLVHCEQTDDINEMQVNIFNFSHFYPLCFSMRFCPKRVFQPRLNVLKSTKMLQGLVIRSK